MNFDMPQSKPWENKKLSAIVSKNGPYLVSGKLLLKKEIIITDKENFPYKWDEGEKYPEQEAYAICRCGHSKNNPFCDGNHMRGFNDGDKSLRG